MNKIVERRFFLLVEKGFLETDNQKIAFLKVLDAIEKSDRIKSLSNPVLEQQAIQKEQVNFINNASEMFTEGWRFLNYFKYYAHAKDVNNVKPRTIWNVINAVNSRDTSKFSKLFAAQKISKDTKRKPFNKGGQRKSNQRNKANPEKESKSTPTIKVVKRRKIEED